MTAFLHRLLHGHQHTRRLDLPTRIRILSAPLPSQLNVVLTAAGERLTTGSELDTLRSMHPRRIAAGS